jgi:histidinol dehydrogenase
VIRRLDASAPAFEAEFAALRAAPGGAGGTVAQTVADIIADIRSRGDAALLAYTNRFDRRSLKDASSLEVPPSS